MAYNEEVVHMEDIDSGRKNDKERKMKLQTKFWDPRGFSINI